MVTDPLFKANEQLKAEAVPWRPPVQHWRLVAAKRILERLDMVAVDREWLGEARKVAAFCLECLKDADEGDGWIGCLPASNLTTELTRILEHWPETVSITEEGIRASEHANEQGGRE
jgi:hypothetical protein